MQTPKILSRLLPAAGTLRADNWQQSLPFLVSALLAIVLAWQVVQLVWTLLGAGPGESGRNGVDVSVGGQNADGSPNGGAGSGQTAASRAFDLNTIVDAHLFGVAAVGNVDPSDAPATQMSLVLVGTIAQTDPEQGIAIIGESSANARVYTVGKTITGGTKLHSVYPDRVILDRGGKLEALLLPKQFRGAPMGGAQTASTGSAPAPMLGDRIRELAQQNPAAIT